MGGRPKFHKIKRGEASIFLPLKEGELKSHSFKNYFTELLAHSRNCAEGCDQREVRLSLCPQSIHMFFYIKANAREERN